MTTTKETYFLFLSALKAPNQMFPPHPLVNWFHVKTFDDFIRLINIKLMAGEVPGLIAFDHNLDDIRVSEIEEGGEKMNHFDEITGYDTARWLVQFYQERNIPLPVCLTISDNPNANSLIYTLLKNNGSK